MNLGRLVSLRWMIKDFSEIREFRDSSLTSLISLTPLTSLNSLNSLNSLILIPREAKALPNSKTNFSSEWCICGADMKKPPMGSTIAYVPLVALIEAPQMRRYHGKLLAHIALNIVMV